MRGQILGTEVNGHEKGSTLVVTYETVAILRSSLFQLFLAQFWTKKLKSSHTTHMLATMVRATVIHHLGYIPAWCTDQITSSIEHGRAVLDPSYVMVDVGIILTE